MSVSATITHKGHVFGDKRVTVTEVTLDSSYTTGGEALTALQLGLNKVVFAHCQIKVPAAACVNAWYDITNSKLQALGASAEINNATDTSGVTAQVTAYGY